MAKKYIDTEKLKAEIERLYDGEAPKHDQQCDFDDGYFTGIGTISRFIDSLQQEQTEVDLEKELQAFLRNYDYEFDDDPAPFDIATHFYELGFNARTASAEE